MSDRVLILGGQGRIGASVAEDLLTHTSAKVTITGRSRKPGGVVDRLGDRVDFLPLTLDDQEGLSRAIANTDLVIHCAGPFSYRDGRVLETCIQQGVNYLDVADNHTFVRKALDRCPAAVEAGVTAIVSTGIFPGISNSMARQAVEQLDETEHLQLSYVVSGSGGAGVTVMRTTFLELQRPFQGWVDGQWQTIRPYSQRQVIEFPKPFGRCGVYWFNTSEAVTLPASFPEIKTVVTKFGSAPDYYNRLTWMMAHWLPKAILQQPKTVEFLAQVSYTMTQISDRFSGIGIAMRVDALGQKDGQPMHFYSTVVHDDTAVSVAYGTGSLAELILSGQLKKPGIWSVEQALPTDLFEQTMQSRGLVIHQSLEPRKA
jgi:saccharopine dehydrogenase-like NADP-dependent oxidoreductase